MNLEGLRIGYWPNVKSLNAAGDRRRFVFYAAERNIKYELADPQKNWDIVYLTSNCNCTEWIDYKKNNPECKIIFELIDSYILENLNLRNIWRGPSRFFRGKEKGFYLDYRKAFIEIIKISDAVVCSTPVQKDVLLMYNKNVHISLDYFSNDINSHKTDYSSSNPLKLVWEGQAYTVGNLKSINNAFSELRDEIHLTIITDPILKYPIKAFNRKTSVLLDGLKCDFKVVDWEKRTFSKLISESDLAIIPIRSDDRLMWNKPENKLLLLWEIGIPVYTSETPAYKRVMVKAGINGICSTSSDWVDKILNYKNQTLEERSAMIRNSTNYLEQYHTKNKILQNWDSIFASVLKSADQYTFIR